MIVVSCSGNYSLIVKALVNVDFISVEMFYSELFLPFPVDLMVFY